MDASYPRALIVHRDAREPVRRYSTCWSSAKPAARCVAGRLHPGLARVDGRAAPSEIRDALHRLLAPSISTGNRYWFIAVLALTELPPGPPALQALRKETSTRQHRRGPGKIRDPPRENSLVVA